MANTTQIDGTILAVYVAPTCCSLTAFRARLTHTRDVCSVVRLPILALFICPHGEVVNPGRPGTPRHDARDWAYARQISAQGNDWGARGTSRA
jgi:hypothetical protein